MGGIDAVLFLHVSGKLYELGLYDLIKVKCYKQTPGHLSVFRTMIKACMIQEHDQLEGMKFSLLSNHQVYNTG